jgi:serine/threonine protein kinase
MLEAERLPSMADVEKFEHFVIERLPNGSLWELGRGAMGVTYKAFDTNLRSDVALKVINAQFLNSDTARQRFLREARAAASLRHPNVATVFHLGNSQGEFFYAMEYIEGETVEKYVQREGPMNSEFALRIARQVCRALIAADRQKLVHRDIKPSNVMLVRDEDEDHLLVKVIDFGLAKSLVAAADQSVTVSMGGFVGTPHFASPEQLEEKEIDVRSDIYSLGATLWFMLTGRPPFQGSMASVIHQHLSQPLPPDLLSKLHPRVRVLVEKMQAKNPDNRFQTPGELKRELDQILAELKGGFPTIAPLAQPTVNFPGTSTSIAGFITGQIIRNRYQILGEAPFDRAIFKAKDMQSNRIVALRPLPYAANQESGSDDPLQQEIARLRTIHHPNLLEVLGSDSYDRGLIIVSEWIKGFSLQDLLRARRALSWEETLRIVKPLSKVMDYVADRQIARGQISLRNIFVEIPQYADNASEVQHLSVLNWPPFIVKIDALAFAEISAEYLAEPTQTVVEPIVGDVQPSQAQQLAAVVYELLGGVKPVVGGSSTIQRFNPLPNLSEPGNTVLRVGSMEPSGFSTSGDLLSKLEQVEQNRESQPPPIDFPRQKASATAGAISGARTPLPDDARPRTSPILLRIVSGVIAIFVVFAMIAVLLFNIFHRPREGAQVGIVQGSVAINSRPEGAIVTWNGQEIGKTPITSYSLPKGKQLLSLTLPGYKPQTIPAEIKDGSLNDIGLIPLLREIGQLTLKSTPSGLSFEIADADNKMTVGTTPQTFDTMPAGKYTVRIKRPGWNDYSVPLDLSAGSAATIEHEFVGVHVTLKSDPAGATISLGQTVLGKTPLTVSLPSEPAELVSRIGALTPVTQQFVPNPSGSNVVEFKHDYGLLAVTSVNADAEVSIGGVELGKPPIEGILPPGKHVVVVKIPGSPDQSRTAEVLSGKRVVMNFTSTNAPTPPAAPVAPLVPFNDGAAPSPTPADQNPGAQLRMPDEVPNPTPRPARTAQPRGSATPVYRNKDDFEHARDQAYKRFDEQWEARKNALERQKDYYDEQADHSEGSTKEAWKQKKKAVEQRLDQLDDQKDAAKKALKRQWRDD